MTLAAVGLACVRGELELFSGLHFSVEPGDALRVGGSNGAGKTSLLRILSGLAAPTEGEVHWNGRDIRRQREEFHAGLLWLGHANGVKDDLLAWENLVVSTTLDGRPATRDAAIEALEQLGLGRAADLPTRSLSQGQRKRVALARLSLVSDAALWILDEPFTALDVAAVDALCGTIGRHLQRGGMVIYTTHQDVKLDARRVRTLDMNRGAPC